MKIWAFFVAFLSFSAATAAVAIGQDASEGDRTSKPFVGKSDFQEVKLVTLGDYGWTNAFALTALSVLDPSVLVRVETGSALHLQALNDPDLEASIWNKVYSSAKVDTGSTPYFIATSHSENSFFKAPIYCSEDSCRTDIVGQFLGFSDLPEGSFLVASDRKELKPLGGKSISIKNIGLADVSLNVSEALQRSQNVGSF